MKNPFFVGRPPGIYCRSPATLEERLAQAGGNTGNLLFISALHKVISKTSAQNFDAFVPEKVRKTHDGIVIPAANWFNYYSDWGGLAERIEETNLPCVIVGLGAQSHTKDKFPTPTAGTLRLVKVVSERSSSISVRGEYTAAALNHYGVKNVTVTGCPSLLWHRRPLNVKKDLTSPTLITIGSTRSDLFEKVFDPGDAFKVSLLLTRLAYARGFDYVAQTEKFDMKVALEGDALISNADSSENMKDWDFLGRVYGETDQTETTRYLKAHLKVFFNVESWLDYLATRDFVISTRLHGIIAALLAGVPGILVTHDTRTGEMAQLLGIPSIDAQKMVSLISAGGLDMNEMYQGIDLANFNKKQLQYFDTFRKFFASNEILTNIPYAGTR
jgi:hypothetical protein